jgi:uncharacterized protein (DUF1499 family)
MKALRFIILLVALVAAILLLVAGPGTRAGIWEFRFGFTLMRWALYGGVAAAVLSIIALIVPVTRRGGAALLLAALVLGAATAAVPYTMVQKARSVPRIHDITTDTANPPEFVAIAPIRADAPNPVAYPGEETAEQQREAYPDVQTYTVDADPARAFEEALAEARAQGWEIVASEADDGRIEATATTFWFGFKDDVVVRIRAADGGSEIDVRSKSRVGLSDVGANAERIRGYLDGLRDRLSG